MNPTPQSLVKCLYLTFGDHLQVSIYFADNRHNNVNHLIQACTWAIHTTVPSNNPYSQNQLTVSRDMIFCQNIKINWQLLKLQQCTQAIANYKKETKKCIQHGYKVGNLVLIVDKSYEQTKKAKLSSTTHGLYTRSSRSTQTAMSITDIAIRTKKSPSVACIHTTIVQPEKLLEIKQ